jgi:hypothetical protein
MPYFFRGCVDQPGCVVAVLGTAGCWPVQGEHMLHSWKSMATVSFIAILLGLTGCGQSPLGPAAPSSSSAASFSPLTPPLVQIAPDGSVSYVDAPVGFASGEPVHLAGTLSTAITTTATIDGNQGGYLKAGRFSVRIPAGAFKGPATVTISMPDSTLMLCQLSITPDAANKFKTPATLTADLSSTGITDAQGFTMYWYDPTKLTWVNLFAKSTVSGATISTSLDHFSTYAAGKAGW